MGSAEHMSGSPQSVVPAPADLHPIPTGFSVGLETTPRAGAGCRSFLGDLCGDFSLFGRLIDMKDRDFWRVLR